MLLEIYLLSEGTLGRRYAKPKFLCAPYLLHPRLRVIGSGWGLRYAILPFGTSSEMTCSVKEPCPSVHAHHPASCCAHEGPGTVSGFLCLAC